MRFRSLIQGCTPRSAMLFEPGPQAEICFCFLMRLAATSGSRATFATDQHFLDELTSLTMRREARSEIPNVKTNARQGQ